MELKRLPRRIRRQIRNDGIVGYRVSKETTMTTENPPANTASFSTSAIENRLYSQWIWGSIPINDPEPGTYYEISCGGVYGTRATSVGTITIRARWGAIQNVGSNTLLATSNALTPAASLSAVPWIAQIRTTIRRVDIETAAGTGLCSTDGWLFRYDGSSVTGAMHEIESSTDDAIDTTIAGGLLLTWQFSSSNVANTCTCQWLCFRQGN